MASRSSSASIAATPAATTPRTSTGWCIAKTDKYYVKKFEAETNITGYLVMDLSQSMGFTHRQELTKFDYAICLAAALGYLMIHQQDPVGLITFDQQDPRQPAAQEQADAARQRSRPPCQPQADRADRHRQKPDADRRHAPAQEPGDDLLRPAGASPARSFKPSAACGTAGTT